MKKSLIALAALGAFAGAASAQSSVTLFGTVDVAVERTKTTTATGASSTNKTLGNNRQGTSQVSVRGVEDLGGGLKGLFLYEGDFDATQSADSYTANTTTGAVTQGGKHSIGSGGGEVFVGLSGGFGTLRLGSPNTPTLSSQAARQPFGTKLGGGFGNVLGTGHVRQDKSVRYDTPSLGGFTASIDIADAASATVGRATDIGLNYAGGPVNVWLTIWKENTNDNKITTLTGSYTFGSVTLMAGYHKEVNPDNKGTNFAVKWGVTPQLNILGNYARQKVDATDVTNKIIAFGPQYLLSKRTSVYARYVKSSNDANDAASTTMLVGMMHNF